MTERIAVIGLGYVGLPVALAFARQFSNVVAFDIVELMPGHPPSAFTAAKLVYRFLAEIFAHRPEPGEQQ